MAAPIEVVSQSGQTLYAVVHNTTGQLWNGTTFETFTAGHWSSYATSLVEQASGGTGTGYYIGAFPSAIGSGKYSIVLYQSGGSPTLGDVAIGSSQIYWNGSIEEQGIAAVLASTTVTLNPSQPGVTIGTVNALGPTALANILAQVEAALSSDQMPELASIPGATPTIYQALMLMYMAIRNTHTATSSQEQITNNSGAVIGTANVSDDSVTFTKSRFN